MVGVEPASLADRRNLFRKNSATARTFFNIRYSITNRSFALVRRTDSPRLSPASATLAGLGRTRESLILRRQPGQSNWLLIRMHPIRHTWHCILNRDSIKAYSRSHLVILGAAPSKPVVATLSATVVRLESGIFRPTSGTEFLRASRQRPFSLWVPSAPPQKFEI